MPPIRARATFTLVILLVVAGALTLGLLAPPVAAQAGTDAAIAQLRTDVRALTELNARLQARIAALEAGVGGTTVKAPFKVLGSSGNAIMTVSEPSDGAGTVEVRGPRSFHILLRASATDSGVLVTSGAGQLVGLRTQATSARILAGAGGITSALSAGTGTDGLVITKGAEEDANTPEITLAEIATRPGKKMAMRLFNDEGKVVVSAGTNPASGGTGSVRVAGADERPVAIMGTGIDGSGVVAVAKGEKFLAALVGAPRAVALYNDAGFPVASLSLSTTGGGGNLTARTAAGVGVFSAGAASDGMGEACVIRQNGKPSCIGVGVPGLLVR